MGHEESVTVVLVDDHPAVVAGIRAWCAGAEPPVQVVDAEPVVAVAWREPGHSARVVIFDLLLRSATPAYADLKRLVDDGRQVIVYTMREDRETALICLDIGAFAYLTKAEGEDHLVAAIQAAAQDRPYTPPTMAGALGTDTSGSRPRLSPRETDVLINWFTCESKEMVADKLSLSVSTVNGYLDRVRIKYANAGRPAPTKAALVARAVQDGIVRVEDL